MTVQDETEQARDEKLHKTTYKTAKVVMMLKTNKSSCTKLLPSFTKLKIRGDSTVFGLRYWWNDQDKKNRIDETEDNWRKSVPKNNKLSMQQKIQQPPTHLIYGNRPKLEKPCTKNWEKPETSKEGLWTNQLKEVELLKDAQVRIPW